MNATISMYDVGGKRKYNLHVGSYLGSAGGLESVDEALKCLVEVMRSKNRKTCVVDVRNMDGGLIYGMTYKPFKKAT
jgi:hypothetical protein